MDVFTVVRELTADELWPCGKGDAWFDMILAVTNDRTPARFLTASTK